jgi:three-Cys-motif partner protein
VGALIEGDDGLPAEDVGHWAKEKHDLLCRYINISRSVRKKWLGPDGAGATYIDLFCGTGRARVRKTGEWIDGSCVAAWKESLAGGTPFSKVYIADDDGERLSCAAQRLKALGAPVVAIEGEARSSVKQIIQRLNRYGLHFAFIDPFNLGAFDFDVMRSLSRLKYIDILVHISKMDLQRNLGFNLSSQQFAFDAFAPGWKDKVNRSQAQKGIRQGIFEHWQSLVSSLGVAPSTEMRLITGSKNQHLYWLMLAAKHDLAHTFWKASIWDGQGSLF